MSSDLELVGLPFRVSAELGELAGLSLSVGPELFELPFPVVCYQRLYVVLAQLPFGNWSCPFDLELPSLVSVPPSASPSQQLQRLPARVLEL